MLLLLKDVYPVFAERKGREVTAPAHGVRIPKGTLVEDGGWKYEGSPTDVDEDDGWYRGYRPVSRAQRNLPARFFVPANEHVLGIRFHVNTHDRHRRNENG